MDQEKVERYHRVFLRNTPVDASKDEKLEALQKKRSRIITMFVLNVFAVALFGYSYYAGISSLSRNVMIAIGVLFTLNIGLMVMQLNQVKAFFVYLKGL